MKDEVQYYLHSFQFNQQTFKKHMENIFEFSAEPTQKVLDGQNEGQPRYPHVKILRRVISTRDA